MSKQKRIKGQYGYHDYQKKVVLLRTAIYFLLSLGIYLLGYFSTGTKENLLTVVAVLGLLPSCKSLVNLIMYMRIPSFSEQDYKQISRSKGDVPVIYSMYLTSYKLNFPINAFAVRDKNVIGYTQFANCDAKACENHIKEILNQNSIKDVTIKVFHDQKQFTNRLLQLKNLEAGAKDEEILTLLGDISL